MNFDKVNAALSKIPEGFRDKEANIGWFSSAQYPDGTPVAYVAIIQEMGAPAVKIPPRPFIRPTIEAQRKAWAKTLKDGVKAKIDGQMSADQVLELVGLQGAGDIRKTISQIQSPPLKDSTIHARASKTASGEVTAGLSKPLIDTGLMLSSCTSQVGPKE